MTTMTSKGQVTIPKQMRDALGLKPGSKLTVALGPPGEVVIRKGRIAAKKPPIPPASRFDRLQGSLKGKLTTDQVMAMTRGED